MLLRLLALLGLLWTGKQVFSQVSSVLHPNRKVDDNASEKGIEDDMVKDPVCLTYLPKSLAIQKTINGKIVHFCSEECALKYVEQHQTEQ